MFYTVLFKNKFHFFPNNTLVSVSVFGIGWYPQHKYRNLYREGKNGIGTSLVHAYTKTGGNISWSITTPVIRFDPFSLITFGKFGRAVWLNHSQWPGAKLSTTSNTVSTSLSSTEPILSHWQCNFNFNLFQAQHRLSDVQAVLEHPCSDYMFLKEFKWLDRLIHG